MNFVFCFKGLALVLLWKLDLFTFIESSSSRLPYTELNPRLLSAYNDNNSNNSYHCGRYGNHYHRRPRYHDANRGKLPPEPPPHFRRSRSRSRYHSGYGYRRHGPTHYRSGYTSHHATYDNDSDYGELIHLDISKEFSTNRYTVSYENNMVVFRARPTYLFSQINHGNEMVWSYKGQGYPNKVTYTHINGKPKVEVHFPEESRRSVPKYRPPGFIYTSPVQAPSQQTNTFRFNVPYLKPTHPIPGHDVMEFELFTVGDKVIFRPKLYTGTGGRRPALITVSVDRFETNDQVIYSYDPNTEIHSLKAREPYLIKEIVQKGQTIWSAKDNKYGDRIILKYDDDGTPTSRILFPDWAMLGMPPPFMSSGQVPTYKPPTPEPMFKETSQLVHPDFQSNFPSVPKAATSPSDHSDHLEQIPTHSDHLPDTIDSSFPPPSTTTTKLPDMKPFELDINIRVPNEQFVYTYDTLSKTMTFVAKNHFRFSCVKYGLNLIWSTDIPAEYANKVTVTGYNHDGMFLVSIYFDDSVIRFFKGKAVPWTKVDYKKPNPLSINVLSNYETFYYTIEMSGKYKIFTAKEGFKFDRVRAGDHEFWETINSNEYAHKVVSEDDEKVTIYMDNEKLINYVKGHRGCRGCKGFMCGLLTLGLYNCTGTRWKEAK